MYLKGLIAALIICGSPMRPLKPFFVAEVIVVYEANPTLY